MLVFVECDYTHLRVVLFGHVLEEYRGCHCREVHNPESKGT